MKNMKNMKNILIVFCLVIVGCSGPKLLSLADEINKDMGENPPAAGGDSYYVDPLLGSMDNPGTKEAPWSTLEEVIKYSLIETKNADGVIRNQGAPVKAGDSIILMSGYHGHVVIKKHFNDSQVSVQAEIGESPELGSLTIFGSKNWSFSGLKISRSFGGEEGVHWGIVAMDYGVSNITIKDSYVFSTDDSSSWSLDDWKSKAYRGIYVGEHKTSNITIENIFFHNVLNGVYSSADNTVIRGSVIVNYAGESIKLRGNNAIVKDNIIRNSITGAGAIRIASVNKSAENIAIINNIIIDNGASKENQKYSIGIVSYNDKLTNFQVVNNLIVTNSLYGMVLGGLNASNVADNIVVGTAGGVNAILNIGGGGDTIINNKAQKMRISLTDSVEQDNIIMSPLPELYNKILASELETKMQGIAKNYGLVSKESGLLKLDLLAMNLPISEPFTEWYSANLTVDNSLAIDTRDKIIAEEPIFASANSLIQYGVTWTFSEGVEYGQFITGDYYVIDKGVGVTVVSVNPLSNAEGNGSMINPVPGGGQGFTVSGYDYKPDLSVSFPISLQAGDALLSSISNDGTESKDWANQNISKQAKLKTVAVLTVLSKHPPAGTFRPSYSDRNQTLYNVSQIDLSVLPEKKLTGTSPLHAGFGILEYFERGMERPWILFGSDWMSRSIHPFDNMNNYHEKVGIFLSEASVLLTSEIPNKELLMHRFIQVGIDYHYNHTDSSRWAWPEVFTGLLLGEPDMYNYWISNPDKRTPRGHEKLYYLDDVVASTESAIIPVNQTWVDWSTSTGKYVGFRKQAGQEYEHLHPSEWLCYKPDCKAELYRVQHDVYPLIGLTLSSILVDKQVSLDVNSMLAHDPIRDYADRWMSNVFNAGVYNASGRTYIQEMKEYTDITIYSYRYGKGGSKFIDEMWHMYR